MKFGPLVDADWLAAHAADPGLRIVDIRWYLDGRSGLAAYRWGHIPGAVFVDLEAITGEGPGRHPLPPPATFEEEMRRVGIDGSSRVVAYDDAGGSVAARLWWLLRLFGHEAAAVLDGGIQAWPLELSTVTPGVERGDFAAAPPGRDRYVDFDQVTRMGPDSVLLDARAPERFRGDVEPVDPRAGHIPGARSAFWQGNLDAAGRFLSAAELNERFASLGVRRGDEVVAYCGSGVNACHHILALELAGLRGARLYAGSWSDWSTRPEAPAATGG